MALTTRSANIAAAARPSRVAVKPVASLNKAVAAVAVATSMAAVAVAPAEAAQVMSTVAAASSGWVFTPPDYLPSVLVPTVGLLVPGLAMATLFTYIEKEAPEN